MLINRVAEAGSRAGDAGMQMLEDNSSEFRAAEEIYQIVAKNSIFEGDGDKALTSDLVILYKNIDIGTKLVPHQGTNKQNLQQTSKTPNQYVETVIYNDDRGSEGSDVSEDISNEDLSHVFAINKERIDLLNNFGDTLCHKLGDIEMHTSGLTAEYDRHFLFNDPYIKEQLKSFHTISKSKLSDSTVFPVSLLDYICCKRLGDSHNFYMDNIIKYVQNTIEQLKRISNGDYLTEKAKAKWREYDGIYMSINRHTPECKKIVLASSASIPLHVANKVNDQKSTWDDIVHSEMDVRSLSRILEKKVIVEVPKIICGTYRLFSKRCKDNLIITCKKDKQPTEESRVDVVLKLQRSTPGHVISNIDSIMILKPLPTVVSETEPVSNNLLALEFEKVNTLDQKRGQTEKNNELDEINEEVPNNTTDCSVSEETDADKFSEVDYDFSTQSQCHECNECENSQGAADFNMLATDDLHCIIHRLSMQSPVIEENEENLKKKKSSLNVRIKSPYENKSCVIEEKKRKKLLEIREKREVKKITRNRYEKSATMAQASNSVTKLSITNKHFYNSIYGESININNKNSRKLYKDPIKVSIPSIKLEDDNENHCNETPPPPLTSPEENSQKYVNRSYYLDEADTEVMYHESKPNESKDLSIDDFAKSGGAHEISVDLSLLKKLMVPSTTDISMTDTSSGLPVPILCDNSFINTENENVENNLLMFTRSTQVAVPTKSPKIEVFTEYENCNTSSVECRRSIDKIYDLIKKISETDSLEVVCSKSKITNDIDKLEASDSGTSTKHRSTSSNPSCLNFEKTHTAPKTTNDLKKKYEKHGSVISNVTLSSKSQNVKFNINTNKENKKLNICKIQENPLKAISQLIHEFDNVQRAINKNGNELKRNKKIESFPPEDKCNSRQTSIKRILKQDQNLKNSEAMSPKSSLFKERRRQSMGNGPFRVTDQQFQPGENPLGKTNRKKIADIIDEEKELRGEAVRGPPKKLFRLNSLAQPKKAYNQTDKQEESQNRIVKRVTDRLSKPTPPLFNPETRITSLRNKQRKVSDAPASTKPPHTVGPPLVTERLSRTKPSTQTSPNRDGNDKQSPVSLARLRCSLGNINKTTELRNGKIVAMETYVKSHYRRTDSQSLELGDSHNVHKSRIPYIPNDIDMGSLISSHCSQEKSTVLGKKLHNMIDAKINSNMPVLGVLTVCKESLSKLERPSDLDVCSIEGRSKSDEIILSVSDYQDDIFEDKNIVTAVSSIPKDNKDEVIIDSKAAVHETNPPFTPNDLPNLENTLYCQISSGAFQEPLSVKNLMLNISPKQSKEKVFILKSGTTSSSLILKSKLSANIDLETDTFSELNILPVLSNNRIDFGFTKFPMQIATVGYAFPHIMKYDSTNKICSLKNEDSMFNSTESENITNKNFVKSIQSFKGDDKVPLQDTIENNETVVPPITSTNKTKQVLENYEVSSIEVLNNEEPTVETETIEDINDEDKKNSNISNSTSLDILVGLLNEIKKITSFESHLPKQENVPHIDLKNPQFEVILNKVAVNESSISLPSLNDLQILKARSSNFLRLSPSVEVHTGQTMIDKKLMTTTSLTYRLREDKEVNAKILPTECMNSFTETPSRLAHLSVTTNITDSLVKLINNSSNQSMYSIDGCDSSNNSLPEVLMEVPSTFLGKYFDGVASSPPVLENQYLDHNDKNKLSIEQNSIAEFDSIMKMKRDILVTVYSVLVLTVFAALSFPEIMYRVY